jgi:uncharacterized protein (TIGR02117 family)
MKFNIFKILCSLLFLVFLYSDSVFGQSSMKDSLNVVYVVNHGWHTGLIIERDKYINVFSGDSSLLPVGRWLEFGWGDKDFYMSTPGEDDVKWGTTLKAILWPTASVLHVAAFDKAVEEYFAYSGLVSFQFSDSALGEIIEFVSDAFTRDKNGRIIPISDGLYGRSQFYESREKYVFPKTCNVWTAKALNRGGLDINPFHSQKAGPLMEKLGELGNIIRESKK